jgi:PAS domain S-box-containing protein
MLFNNAFQKMYTNQFGRPIIKGDPILDHTQPERREMVINNITRALSGEAVEWELESAGTNGKLITVNIRYRPAFDEAGKIAGVILTIQDISHRKWSEQQLIFNERKFRRLVENGNEAIAILSPNIQPNYISPSVQRVLGYTPEELMEMDVLSLVHPEDVSILKEALAIAMANPGIPGKGHIVRALHKNQTWRWLEASLTNMLHDPAIGGIVDNFRDVTEKKLADEKIRIAKERYDTVLKATNEAVWEWDIQTSEVHWGEGFRSLFGYDAELISRNVEVWDALFHPDDSKRVLDSVNAVVESESQLQWESQYRFLKSDGQYVHVLDRGILIRDEEGKPLRMIGAMQDISSKLAADEALRDSEEKTRLIMNSALDAIICMDKKGLITFWNPQAEKIFGWKTEEVMGMRLSDTIIPVEFRERHSRGLEAYAKSGQGKILNTILELSAINKNNTEFPIELTVLPIQQGNQEFFCAFVRDITARKTAEQQLKKRAEELTASNAELEQFAYVASHDLQEPLRMVSSFLQLLEKKYAENLDETANQYIQFAVDGSNRMKSLILDLLEYSRVNTSQEQRTAVDMSTIINQVLDTYSCKIVETNASVKVSLMPVARVNKMQMSQLFQNLIGNALKYNKSAQPAIEIGYEEHADSHQFHVKDNGIGIDPKFYERIFIIFQRLHTKNQFSGTGIGLAICKKIVEKHEGRIWVESVPGKGSTFYFTVKK